MAFVESGRSRVWWDAVGDGTHILLINGLSSPSAAWFRLVPLLSPQHRVITFDNLGTGWTETAPGGFTMTMLAEAAAEVVRAAGALTAHVLGMSMGGLIAQELALTHPNVITSLILVSTHAGGPHMINDQDSLDTIARAGELPSEDRTKYLASLAYAATTPQERIDEDLAARAQPPTSEQGYRDQLAATGQWERLDALGELHCPTLVLHGEEDQIVSAGNARQLAQVIPGAQLTVLPGCGHQLFTDQPEPGARAVLDFLAAVDRKS